MPWSDLSLSSHTPQTYPSFLTWDDDYRMLCGVVEMSHAQTWSDLRVGVTATHEERHLCVAEQSNLEVCDGSLVGWENCFALSLNTR